MDWFDKLIEHAATLLASGAPLVLAGDFNVMPTERDVYKPERWTEDALFAPEVRAAFFRLLEQGWIDALRTIHPDETRRDELHLLRLFPECLYAQRRTAN